MKWMKERDLLIAQTMAFVQSVTGKAPEVEETNATQVEARRVEARAMELFETIPAPAQAMASVAPLPAQTPQLPLAAAVQAQPIAEARVPAVVASAELVRETPRSTPLPRVDLREDFQSEIRARVASFRAHQERFTREREAYCTATMAKVHATLKDGDLPLPPLKQ